MGARGGLDASGASWGARGAVRAIVEPRRRGVRRCAVGRGSVASLVGFTVQATNNAPMSLDLGARFAAAARLSGPGCRRRSDASRPAASLRLLLEALREAVDLRLT